MYSTVLKLNKNLEGHFEFCYNMFYYAMQYSLSIDHSEISNLWPECKKCSGGNFFKPKFSLHRDWPIAA